VIIASIAKSESPRFLVLLSNHKLLSIFAAALDMNQVMTLGILALDE